MRGSLGELSKADPHKDIIRNCFLPAPLIYSCLNEARGDTARMMRKIRVKSLLLLGAVALFGSNSALLNAQDDNLRQQVIQLRALVEKLQARVDDLEKRANPQAAMPPAAEGQGTAVQAASPATPQTGAVAESSKPPAPPVIDFLRHTTLNILFDGYYGYNFNNPIGRVNLLRAYDVSSNAFSLSQAALVLETAPDPSEGRRFGIRLDFQCGQATATLQGNSANEPRPGIYQNIFQAYGTYVVPVGKGLTVDFGKFASSLGMEGNYTKDQMNYSRSYWFAYLPFYHMGVRANYKFNDAFAINYWAVNGTQQTEPFNGFKDQFFGLNIQPRKNISWNVNYYLGQEHPDVTYYPNGGAPAGLPTEQGTPFLPLTNQPTGKLHIFDTYLTWDVSPKLKLAAEGDYVIEREFTNSSPEHTGGGALYAQYQLTPKFSLAGRAEYLSDRGGLFTGRTQALKDTTFTLKYAAAGGFLVFGEWRRDSSNRPFFYTDMLGILKNDQNTATVGLVWWLGSKQGAW